MGPRRDRSLAKTGVQIEGLLQGPKMLKRLEAAGRHPATVVPASRRIASPHPRAESGVIGEARHGRLHGIERLAAEYRNTGAARPEQPLVASGHEHVAAEFVEGDILDPEPVNAVDAEKDMVRRIAARVHIAKPSGDGANGHLQPRAGMDPGQRDKTGFRADGLEHGCRDGIGRGVEGVLVERDRAQRGA